MRKVLLTILMIAAVSTVSAQSKWSYSLGFGGELKSGNVNTTIFNTNGGIQRNDSILSFDANASYVYGLKDKVKYEDNFTGNIKFDLWQYDRWSPFVSASYNHNLFKGYYYRINFLAGVKYRIYWDKNCDYSISGAYVYEYSDYIDSAARADLGLSVNRISLRFKGKQKICDNVTIKNVTFYTPCVTDFGDYGVTSTTSLSTALSKHLSLDLNFSYEYHSRVPVGVEKTDIITSASLKMTF